MRSFIISFALLITSFAMGVERADAQRIVAAKDNAYVNLVSEGKGTITVRGVGYGSNQAQAQEDAEKRVVNALIFVGLPNAPKYGAMVDDPAAAESEHADYFSGLFEGRKYKKVVTSSISKGVMSKVKGMKEKSMPFDITINYAALRRDLELNKVIRKFGF